MLVREATAGDWPAIWPFLRRIVAAGETYCVLATIPEAFAHPTAGYVGLHVMHRRL